MWSFNAVYTIVWHFSLTFFSDIHLRFMILKYVVLGGMPARSKHDNSKVEVWSLATVKISEDVPAVCNNNRGNYCCPILIICQNTEGHQGDSEIFLQSIKKGSTERLRRTEKFEVTILSDYKTSPDQTTLTIELSWWWLAGSQYSCELERCQIFFLSCHQLLKMYHSTYLNANV